MQKEETKNLLIEVRKSYRLLYEYQKRILDLVDYIGKKYEFVYNGGYSKFSNSTPRNGGGRLDSLAWDWLNLYYYEFHFNDKESNNDIIYFSIFILNDDGYFQSKKSINIDKTAVSEFYDIEKSHTKLILVAGKNLWESWGKEWDDLDFILGAEDKNTKIKQNNQIMIFKHFLVEDFYNEESALKCLTDFEDKCYKNGINIKINKIIK